MMSDEFDELTKEKKIFGKIFFYSISGVFTFYLFIGFFVQNIIIVPKSILFFGFFLTAYTAYILLNTKYDFIRLYSIITFFLGLFIYYLTLLISHLSGAIFFMFVPVVLMIMLISSFWKSVFWSIVIIILCFFASDFSSMVNLKVRKDFFKENPEFLLFNEYLVIVIATYFSFLILYYNNRFIRIGVVQNQFFNTVVQKQDVDYENDISIKNSSKKIIDKDQILYDKILKCFDEQKPFRQPDFNIKKLAELVDSNSTYVSRALNSIGNKKFNQLVNEYRIEQVRQDILDKRHQKFTLEHIYTKAGFSQQSTFNRIFKEYTGITPSEYIEMIK